jgi:hypothetical protein
MCDRAWKFPMPCLTARRRLHFPGPIGVPQSGRDQGYSRVNTHRAGSCNRIGLGGGKRVRIAHLRPRCNATQPPAAERSGRPRRWWCGWRILWRSWRNDHAGAVGAGMPPGGQDGVAPRRRAAHRSLRNAVTLALDEEKWGSPRVSGAGESDRLWRARRLEPIAGFGIVRELGAGLNKEVAQADPRARNAALHRSDV